MGNRIIDRVVYDALLQAFANAPGEFQNAADAAGTTRPTARKAWHEGWPKKGFEPIKGVLEEARRAGRALRWRSTQAAEQEAAALLADAKAQADALLAAADKSVRSKKELAEAEYKARLEKAEADAKAKVDTLLNASRLDAAATMASEARIATSARNTALAAFGVGGQVFERGNIVALGQRIVQGLLQGKPLNPASASRVMRDLGIFMRSLVAVGEAAIVIERKRVGAPEATLSVQAASGPDMTVEDADVMLQALQNAVAKAKAKGQEENISADETGETSFDEGDVEHLH